MRRSQAQARQAGVVSAAAVAKVYGRVRRAEAPPTVPEIAHATGLSGVVVRRALGVLEAQGRVRVFYGPPAAGRTTLRGKTHYRYVATGAYGGKSTASNP